MSDRCYLEVRVLKAHARKFASSLDSAVSQPSQETENCVVFVEEEANGGSYDELQEAARAGLMFVSVSGPGDAYGPCKCAGALGQFFWCESDVNGCPTITLDIDGRINGGELLRAQECLAARRRVKVILDGPKLTGARANAEYKKAVDNGC